MAEEAYNAALAFVKDKTNVLNGVPNERKLKLYSLYKQINEGDVTGSQPWAVQLEARAKWDAWNSIKDKTKVEAMQEYADEVEAQKKDYGS